MSYILEALRKSHHDREQTADRVLQRSAIEVRQLARRRQLLLWAGVGLLGVNVVLAAWLIRYGVFSQHETAMKASVEPDTSMPTATLAGQRSEVESVSAQSQSLVDNDATLVARDMALERQQDFDRRRSIDSFSTVEEDSIAGAEASPDTSPAAASSIHVDPVEDSSLVLGAAAATTGDMDAALESLPLLMNMDETFRSRWANLSLDVHVFSAIPNERFVFINMAKYREGDTTQEGLLVNRIVADGVVLEGEGKRFRLLPQ